MTLDGENLIIYTLSETNYTKLNALVKFYPDVSITNSSKKSSRNTWAVLILCIPRLIWEQRSTTSLITELEEVFKREIKEVVLWLGNFIILCTHVLTDSGETSVFFISNGFLSTTTGARLDCTKDDVLFCARKRVNKKNTSSSDICVVPWR